jgi:hypothetical protein
MAGEEPVSADMVSHDLVAERAQLRGAMHGCPVLARVISSEGQSGTVAEGFSRNTMSERLEGSANNRSSKDLGTFVDTFCFRSQCIRHGTPCGRS